MHKLKSEPQATVSKTGAKISHERMFWQRGSTYFGLNCQDASVILQGNYLCIHAHVPLIHTVRFTDILFCILIIFTFAYVWVCVCICSLRWRWSLRASRMEVCSQRATVTSAMPSSSPSPNALLTMRWVPSPFQFFFLSSLNYSH